MNARDNEKLQLQYGSLFEMNNYQEKVVLIEYLEAISLIAFSFKFNYLIS